MKSLQVFLLLIISSLLAEAKPLRLGVAGFTHDHVHQILSRPDKGDVEIVGVAEPNRELAMRYLKRYKLSEKLWYPSLEAMIAATQPEAVCAFNSIYEHKQVVEICAPKGIHVMVEKPLAVNREHAEAADVCRHFGGDWLRSVQPPQQCARRAAPRSQQWLGSRRAGADAGRSQRRARRALG